MVVPRITIYGEELALLYSYRVNANLAHKKLIERYLIETYVANDREMFELLCDMLPSPDIYFELNFHYYEGGFPERKKIFNEVTRSIVLERILHSAASSNNVKLFEACVHAGAKVLHNNVFNSKSLSELLYLMRSNSEDSPEFQSRHQILAKIARLCFERGVNFDSLSKFPVSLLPSEYLNRRAFMFLFFLRFTEYLKDFVNAVTTGEATISLSLVALGAITYLLRNIIYQPLQLPEAQPQPQPLQGPAAG